ncbi:molybdopterin molybdotransferase MoeA [Roseateles oligotrophus]|uniref:Molybdopterin molybdenumtransferase n=1 Tax=Roseateles oligotrophus TaxID=1769250 RepID=A0ABT2Y9A6_9BURK|nr:gephyrin-like molybdotransferase Glp [Roseateles oligotrophus]MCV2366858.1 molybdopterin molybdotransferase MoeA [Roseateles oligotrophus]
MHPMNLALADIAAQLDGYDPQALPVDVAQKFISKLLPLPQQAERVGLRAALGRVLAADIISPLQVPAADNSAMDGYALRASDLAVEGETRLRLAGTSLAGSAPSATLAPGHCQRIMTGALMPPGLDTVVPQELTRVAGDSGEFIVISPGILRAGDNRRLAGEDLALGSVALAAGRILKPADLGLLASLGLAEVPVWRRLKVAIMSTGDELRGVGAPLPAGCVYDSNRYTMWAMLERLGLEVIDLGIVRDQPAALRDAFTRAAAEADAVISSGGVSVGEADHTKQVMAELGEVLFWKIAMRPGRPMAIGRINSGEHQALLFGLPGNPVAVMVTFYAFVREALLRMSGASPDPLPMLRASSSKALRKKAGRTEYQRGIVGRGQDGQWQVDITGNQGSGILSSMSQANGLVVLGHAQGDVAAGDWVDVLPFDGLI